MDRTNTSMLEPMERHDAPEVIEDSTTRSITHYTPKSPYESSSYGYLRHDAPPVPTLSLERTVCGVRRKIFWFLVALAVIVVTVAVAGSVGGSIAVQNSRTASSSQTTTHSTATSTTSASVSPNATATASAASGMVSNVSVPPISQVASLVLDSTIQIYSDAYNGTARFQPFYKSTLQGADVLAIPAYSMQACVDSCLLFNFWGWDPPCIAVEFRTNMAEMAGSQQGANCFLKAAPLPGKIFADTSTVAVLCKDTSCSSTVA